MSPVGPNTREFLRKAGMPDEHIDRLSGNTSINIDLGWDGDNFFDDMRPLSEEYGVDFSDFDWSRYVKSEGELSSPHFLFRILKFFIGRKAVNYSLQGVDPFRKLEPLTLDMIEQAIVAKKWN
jgi:Protein of unknown function (DUF1493)